MKFYNRCMKQEKNSKMIFGRLTSLRLEVRNVAQVFLFLWLFFLFFMHYGHAQVIPKTNWSLSFVDSQESVGENGAAINAFDGNVATIWHTEWFNSDPPPPHEIQINLGALYNIRGFRYLPRQDGGANGRINEWEFYVSMDGTNWGSAVATGTFANTATEKEVPFIQTTGQYVRLRAQSEVHGNPWTSMAEISVLEGALVNQAPDGVVNTPIGDVTINVGDSVYFTGTGSDPDGHALTYLWQFGTASGVGDFLVNNPGTVTFHNPGTFTVTLTVTDELGLADPSQATRTVSVQGGIIPDWINIIESPLRPVPSTVVPNPVLKAGDVTDVSARFVADTFLFYENTTWYMFIEIYNNSNNHGDLAIATSSDGSEWNYQQIVLNEPFHLSYPYVFKFNDSYYMIPETFFKNEIRLYRATNFPYAWNYLATLVKGKDFVDSSIFRYNGKWWIFTGDTTNSNCYLYYSDTLTSGWVQHPMSPIVKGDASKARPAGRAFVYDTDRVIRVAQKCNVVYGEKVRAFEADTLTTTQYVEHEVPESPILSNSGTGWNATGMHQFDPWWTENHWNCGVDGKLGTISVWSAGIYLSPHPSSPNGVIDSPATNVTINKGQSVNFAGTGSDTDSNLPLSFQWKFGAGSGISDSTLEDPGSVQFNIPGTFTVSFTVTDSLGIYDPTPGVRTISVLNTSTVIPKTSWSLRSVDSQELVGENGAAVNCFDGNSGTIWHTKWFGGTDPLPHEIQINLGAAYNVSGFRYLPRQGGGVNGRIKQWEFYVSTDGTNWGSAVATGTFTNDTTEKEVFFTQKTGQYVRLRALSEVNNKQLTSMAEITVLQD